MITHVILAGLAGWRIASLFNWEPGPWNIFGRVRRAVGAGGGEVTSELGKLMVCPWCLTMYTTGTMLALGALLSWWIPAVFAAMGVAMMAERWASIVAAVERKA